MSHIEIDGKCIEIDAEGFLIKLSDWSEAVAHHLARAEGLELSDAHMEILHLLRRFHSQFQLSPAMRPLVKFVGQELGKEKGSSIYLLSLFPGSPAKLASKLAGLPKPDNCL